jgi:hypothetical protein
MEAGTRPMDGKRSPFGGKAFAFAAGSFYCFLIAGYTASMSDNYE